MTKQKIQTVKDGFLDNVNKEKAFIVWSRPGNGSVTYLMDHLGSPVYYGNRIATSHLDYSDLVNPEINGQVLLPNFIEAARQAREINGKKLAFIFDEISNSSPAGIEAFSKAVLERNVLGLELSEGDIILATGMLDPKGNPFMGGIPLPIFNSLSHYVIDFERQHA
jgi:hypothetical protein